MHMLGLKEVVALRGQSDDTGMNEIVRYILTK
jgi:hypothetical protein